MSDLKIILISGPSCAGKSTLAENLRSALQGERICLDDYYYESDPADFATTNFDDPALINIPLLVEHIVKLRSGSKVDSPKYDFNLCQYTSYRELHPNPYLVIEGQYAALYEDLKPHVELSVFLDVELTTCLARRIDRDFQTLGRPPEEAAHRFNTNVAPAFQSHRDQLLANSHLILTSETRPNWEDVILSRLNRSTLEMA